MNIFNIDREEIDNYFKTHPRTRKLLGVAAWVAGTAAGAITIPGLDPTMFDSMEISAKNVLEKFSPEKYHGVNGKIVDGILGFVGKSKEKQKLLLDILTNYLKLANEIEKAEFDDFMDSFVGSDLRFKVRLRRELKDIEPSNGELHDLINDRFGDLHFKPERLQKRLDELKAEFPSTLKALGGAPEPSDVEHYNGMQCLAAHNSYNANYFNKKLLTLNDVITYQLIECKARGLEYDVYETPELSKGDTFQALVSHEAVTEYNPKKHVYYLKDWLKAASEVINGIENHEPIVIHIEAKKITNKKEFPERLDKAISEFFDVGSIFTPVELEEFLDEWPTEEHLRGRVIFVLSGILSNLKEQYDECEGKLAFVDMTPTEYLFDAKLRARSFINFYADAYKLTLSNVFVDMLRKQKKIMRAWRANKKKTLQDLMFRGVQMLATDIFHKERTYKKANPMILPPDTGYQFLDKLDELRAQIHHKRKI
ncbi:MAG TPA: hypothetical protein VKM55_02855 [Candidatus Lokiarchaeia archaeon]|nr:hypothetical protein [Candidatus Lokiarchaeia archaeon]